MKAGTHIAPLMANGGVANGYMALWKCTQLSGATALADSANEVSGSGADSAVMWSSTAPWATPGEFITTATADQNAKLFINKWPHRFATDALCLSFWAKLTKQGGAIGIFGTGLDTTHTGFQIRLNTDGTVQVVFRRSDGSQFTSNTTAVLWNTAVWSHLTMMYDPTTAKVWLYVNGVVDATFSLAGVPVTTPSLLDGLISNAIFIGASWQLSGVLGVAGSWRYIHALYRAGKSLPLNAPSIARRLYLQAWTPLTVAEWDKAL